MASDHNTPTPDYSGLQAVPGSEIENVAWSQQHYQGGWSATIEPSYAPYELKGQALPHEPKQRILGLSVRAFWITVIALVVILAGGIGGGVGGGLAARSSSSEKQADGTGETAGPPTGLAASATSSSPTSETSSPISSSPVSSASLSPSPTPSTPPTTVTRASGGFSPAPVDGGCPGINNSAYKPHDASGTEIKLDGKAQSFVRLCATDYPTGPFSGNDHIHDIMKLYLPSLEDCITACAAYNVQYRNNLKKGLVADGGLCRAVTVVKKAGEYCYLKNGTATNKTGDHPEDVTSAALEGFE